MTNEELLKKFQESIEAFHEAEDEHDESIALIEQDDLRAELLRRLGAAVSASPQPEKLAQLFHETYERLAPQFGYETRKESAKAWIDIPPNNRRLMIAVCAEMSQFFAAAPAQEPPVKREDWVTDFSKRAVENSPQKGKP